MNKINFLQKNHINNGDVYYPRKKSKIAKFSIYISIILLISLASFSWQIFSSYEKNKNTNETNSGIISSIRNEIKHFVTLGHLNKNSDRKLKGEEGNRINVLLLGIGGEGHQGTYLSDTMIVASVDTSQQKISLISIPRDLYVPIEEYGWHKINHANAYGENKKQGYGGILASKTVGKIFNIPIHYYVRADFDGFKKIIDDIGKINVYVDNSFVDEKYPDNNFGYNPVNFQQGSQNMDGDRALKYARSRHGNNNEGSDFARSKRQQKILLAVKEKMSNFHFWLNPKKIGTILANLENHINTNMEIREIVSLSNILKKCDFKNINHIVLSNGKNGHLYETNFNGAYVLLPKNNDFTSLKILAKNIFDPGVVAGATSQQNSYASIEVRNGTKITGLAGKIAQDLKQNQFKITKIGNAKKQDYKQTIIYDLTRNSRTDELIFLKNRLNAVVSLTVPDWLTSQTVSGAKIGLTNPDFNSLADFIIILGENADR
ncbi:MAG: LCP family protein [Patescibacteria group bacterium]|nr:LCP family protein [Patescibacteria group bacterium]